MRTLQTLATLCLSAVLLSPAAAAEELYLSVNFDLPIHSTRVTGDVLAVPGADLIGRPGEPLLPRKTVYFLLPYGHRVVDVKLSNLVVEPVEGIYDIAPAQRPVPLSRMHLARPTPPDPEIYSREAAFPGRWFEPGSIQFKHGYAVLPVTLHPLSYHPKTGQVNRIASVTVTLETGPGGPVSKLLRAEIADTDKILRLADVVTPVRSYPNRITRGPNELPPGDYQYVIVAPQVFLGLGGSNSLEALRDARIAGGLTATIEPLEDILATFDGYRPDGGHDDATRVRQFLTAAHNEWGTQYALLVGDADAGDAGGESGDMIIPVRGIWVDGGQEMQDNLPADQYYSCLDGSYDADADGLYGESRDGPGYGEVDLLAELYVGRAPADSAGEVQNFVAKTLGYENAAGTWLEDVWMLGEWLFDGPVWGGDFMDGIIHGTNAGGYNTLGFDHHPFFECHTLYDRDEGGQESWDATNLIPILNNGPHIVNHLGHSNNTYNMRMVTTDVDALFNIHPFFHYSQGCYNGAFDNSLGPEMGNRIESLDCFAEHLLLSEHGAFATASNSRYGLGSYTDDGPSNRFHRQFWDAFFAEGVSTIGEAFADCKDDNADAYDDLGVRWAGFTVNLLGDPALALKKSINTTDPLLGVYPPGFVFFSRQGDPAPDPAEMFVRNDGVGQLTFSASADQTWIGLSPSSGSAPLDLEVQVDPSSLEPGTHEGVITVTSPEAPNSPVEVTVEQIVVEVPEIRVPHIGTTPLITGIIEAGEYDAAVQLPIDDEGTGEVTLYMAVSGDNLYLAVDDQTDVTDGNDGFILAFDKNLDGFWPTAPGDEGAYRTMGRRTFFVPYFNSGGGVEMGGWNLWEDDPEGFDSARGFEEGHRVYEISLNLVTSHVDIGTESIFGLYFRTLDIVDWNISEVTGHWPLWVPEMDDQRFFGKVDMAPEGPRLDSSPLSLTFNAVVDGSIPAPQMLAVFDREGGNIDFTASAPDAWLSVSPAVGQTPGDLEVSVDHSGLLPGDHPGRLIIEAEAWNSPYTVPVLLRVWSPNARLEVEPGSLHITAAAEGPDPQAEFTVANTGGQPMNYRVIPSASWVGVDSEAGSIGPYSERSVIMTADLSTLGQGSHPAEIEVRAGHPAENTPQVIAVQLDIVSPRSVPPVEGFGVGVLDQSLQLNWTCPDDPLVARVNIRRSTGAPPANPDLGEDIYDGMEETYTDAGLQNGVKYCYSAFAYDAAGRYSEPATACGIPGSNRAPPMPELLSPANSAAVPATPELVASTVTDPDGDVVAYTFVLLDISGGTLDSAVVEGSGTRVNWKPNAQLEPETSYRWQVEAIDSQGAHSGFAETRSFVIRPATGVDGGQPPGDDDPDCGCGNTSSAAPGLLLLLAGLLLLGRRRF